MLKWLLWLLNAPRELEELREQQTKLLEMTKMVPGDTLEKRVRQLLIWSEMSEAQ